MKDSLVIISACQYTQVVLMHLLSEEKYHIRIFFNVNTEVESVLNSSCGYLLVDISSLSHGEKVLLACILRLRKNLNKWLVCLTGKLDNFNYSPVSKLYNRYHHISYMLTVNNYQKELHQWLTRPLPNETGHFRPLTFRELEILKILMQGRSLSEASRYEQRSLKTLHTIAVQALMKLGIDTIREFKLLYTGCANHKLKKIQHRKNFSGRKLSF